MVTVSDYCLSFITRVTKQPPMVPAARVLCWDLLMDSSSETASSRKERVLNMRGV